MQYALLIYENTTAFAQRHATDGDALVGAWRAYYKAVVEAGIYVDGGNPLREPETATTVRIQSGKRSVQDGPYANTKEQLGGFMLIDVPSLDVALAWAARCPAASYGAVEVRPLAPEMHQRITRPHA
jgi:hypothetical protein